MELLAFAGEESFQVLNSVSIMSPEKKKKKTVLSSPWTISWVIKAGFSLIYLCFWCVSAKWLNFTRILLALKHKERVTDLMDGTAARRAQLDTYFSRHDEGREDSPLHMEVSVGGKK